MKRYLEALGVTNIAEMPAEELAKHAGIKLSEETCPKCAGLMEKTGAILKCACGMMKKANLPVHVPTPASTFFREAVPSLANRVLQHPGALMGGAVGALGGATVDDDHRLRGALLGGAAGAVGGHYAGEALGQQQLNRAVSETLGDSRGLDAKHLLNSERVGKLVGGAAAGLGAAAVPAMAAASDSEKQATIASTAGRVMDAVGGHLQKVHVPTAIGGAALGGLTGAYTAGEDNRLKGGLIGAGLGGVGTAAVQPTLEGNAIRRVLNHTTVTAPGSSFSEPLRSAGPGLGAADQAAVLNGIAPHLRTFRNAARGESAVYGGVIGGSLAGRMVKSPEDEVKEGGVRDLLEAFRGVTHHKDEDGNKITHVPFSRRKAGGALPAGPVQPNMRKDLLPSLPISPTIAVSPTGLQAGVRIKRKPEGVPSDSIVGKGLDNQHRAGGASVRAEAVLKKVRGKKEDLLMGHEKLNPEAYRPADTKSNNYTKKH
jgi:hypothetical protein